MSTPLLKIEGLHVSVDEKEILHGVDLEIGAGQVHVLMGPNGTGKSTLVSAVMGDPRFTVTEGRIYFKGEDVTEAKTDERARMGMFLSFQAPQEIPGITLENFIRTACGAVSGKQPKLFAFRRELREQMARLGLDESYAERYLNVGFSGGEKKKSEILQLLMMKPALALLDETDSGLDVDAVRTVTEGIKAWHNAENSLLIITHNAKILEGLDVDHVHVLSKGLIVRQGGAELVREITEGGFASVKEED
ncbi:MAG: Fe-S cluster assembly ATPase SufC [Oscillospiraceae bacterium]|nr:Fe-S cluster assembly ATPase SufC [Oscillospiraceae bacterium]